MLIEIESLTKRYGDLTALDNCSLSIAEGEVFGLLGPNGAGKTTLMRLLLGFLRPTSGEASIAGFNSLRQSLQVRHLAAYLPGEPRLSRQMRGHQILRFYCSLRREASCKLAMQIAEQLELDLSRRVAMMSTGMRQKLAIAITFAANAPLMILDEPTSNLDPTVRARVIRLVGQAAKTGKTVIFSSHILSEVEQVCDRVAILRQGQLVHTQHLHDSLCEHRLTGHLTGPLPPGAADDFQITTDADNSITIELSGDLATQLDRLATLPIAEARIEPVGLTALYHKYHGDRE